MSPDKRTTKPVDIYVRVSRVGDREGESFQTRPLLRDGVLISEQVANARSLVGRRAEFLFLLLNIVGGDRAPARVLGRAIHD